MAEYGRRGQKLETYLVKVILAILKTHGPELRIKQPLLDIEDKVGYYSDYDPETNEVIFRLGSKNAELVFVNPGETKGEWVEPGKNKQPIQPIAPVDAEPQRRKANLLEENERLTELDNRLKQRSIARMVVEEQQRNLKLQQS